MTNYTILNATGATANAAAAAPNAARGITTGVAITAIGDFIGLAVAGVYYAKDLSNTQAILSEVTRITGAASTAAGQKAQIASIITSLGTVDLSSLAKIEQFRLKRSVQDLQSLCDAIGGAAVLS